MYKIANQIIDAYDDIHADFLTKIAAKRPETYVMTPEEKSTLGDDDYALCCITKEASKVLKFPVDSYDNTYLANEMFPETYYKLQKTAAIKAACMIKKACDHFRIIPNDVVVNVSNHNASFNNNLHYESDEGNFPKIASEVQTKTASDNMKVFADVERICDNYCHAQYVFATPVHVKVASKYFDEKHKEMPVELRHKYAAALQIRAKELGMPSIRGNVEKYASDSYNAMLDGHLASRKRLVDGSAFEAEFGKIASLKKSATPYQFAQVLAAFDKKAGLARHYGSYLTDPYQSTFATSADPTYTWMNKKGSRQLTAQEIESVVNTKTDKIAQYIGKLAAEGMKKDPTAIFDSMPNDVKEIIANIHEGTL